MKLSTRGRYGLRAMVDLVINSKENNISLKSISKRQGISVNYLEQIISILKKAGYVKSARGAKGGYSLAKSPKDISVGDVLRALEGNLNPVDCALVNEGKQCDEADFCITKVVWKKISDSINDVVNNMSLQDLVDGHDDCEK
ncbi:AsnC family transcriptional regulator [Vallitalea longa]|jgi:Rrf2 family transcriptional regulator, cysteine metabolism repressor|uniref:AsnC family transcriptional regulator n=1 Tax=Vallitalea longa TaxID=2936439 RepID=A0A9W5Y8I0_9FIRM|nr:Rrf2 family transcriptional regulator [Vallitalea longa]GKX29137.1 AsnC family transcriptional regulator [Vallitalea longa]